jgi:CheY-like chemotaxis protein
MDEATLQRAFEPFFTTRPKGERSGLGLATVYGIITQAGGSVRLYSEPGHGTSFNALLPAAETAQGARHEVISTAQTSGSETILLVEDEDALRQVTARILRRNGYRVLSAANGPEAITVVKQHEGPIELLITDVVMPYMLGREVAAQVTDARPGIQVLYISGYAQAVLGAQGTLDAGVALLQKPFSERLLLSSIRERLDAPYSL